MSRHNYNELLKTAYELEGLLALQDRRGHDAAEAVDTLIADKIALLAEAFNTPAVTSRPEQTEPEVMPDAAPQPYIDTPVQPIIETPVQPTIPTTDSEAVAASALDEEVMMADEPVEPATTFTAPASETPTAVNDVIDTPVSLEEKLARERARDIFKAFTLNDKFRFRRELFRNSQEEFDEALDIISQMSTVEEAEEYIYNDLCWNPDNEDVKAFMDVVIKHF